MTKKNLHGHSVEITVTLLWQKFCESNAFTKKNTKESIWRNFFLGDSKFFIFPHCEYLTPCLFSEISLLISLSRNIFRWLTTHFQFKNLFFFHEIVTKCTQIVLYGSSNHFYFSVNYDGRRFLAITSQMLRQTKLFFCTFWSQTRSNVTNNPKACQNTFTQIRLI